MTFTQRKRLHDELETLKDRGTVPVDVWFDLVEEAVRATCPPESAIHQRLKAVRGSQTEKVGDHDPRIEVYRAYLTGAQRILALRSLDEPDTTLEHEVISILTRENSFLEPRVLQILDNKLLETRTAKMLKFVAPFLLALLFSGTVWAGFHVKGIFDQVKEQFADMTVKVKEKHDQAIKAIEKQETDGLKAVAEKRKEVLDGLVAAVGSKDPRKGMLGDIDKTTDDAIQAIKSRERYHLESLDRTAPGRIAALQARLERLGLTANKVDDAYLILKGQTAAVPISAIGLLLGQSVLAMALVGFIAGVVGAAAWNFAARFLRR